jgi:cobalt-zinc-cadmium efflux system protein
MHVVAQGADSRRFIVTDSSHHHHHHSHDHAGHHHGHHHAPAGDFSRAFALAIVLNSGFVALEFAYGFIAHSTALLADAGHNLSDVLALAMAWGAALLGKKQPSGRYTYGLRSTSILAALFNAMLLMAACGAIAWAAVQRLWQPYQVDSLPVTVVAALGIAVNGASAWLFVSGSKNDVNIRGAFLHMAADAAVSLGVVIAGLIMLATGWTWPDPVVSLLIVAVIVAGTWSLLKEAVHLSLNAVPSHIDLARVENYLLQLPGVQAVDDLHIWGMSTTETALTAFLIMPDGTPSDEAMDDIAAELKHQFAIHHSTLQVRQNPAPQSCAYDANKADGKGEGHDHD